MAIKAIKGSIHSPWTINLIIRDILHYMKQMTQVSLSNNYREANLAIDWLAKLGHELPSLTTWGSSPSPELRAILGVDMMDELL